MKKSRNRAKKRGPIIAAIRNQNFMAQHLDFRDYNITNLRFVEDGSLLVEIVRPDP